MTNQKRVEKEKIQLYNLEETKNIGEINQK